MKIKTIEIHQCADCPSWQRDEYGRYLCYEDPNCVAYITCDDHHRHNMHGTFPEWCPLKEKE